MIHFQQIINYEQSKTHQKYEKSTDLISSIDKSN